MTYLDNLSKVNQHDLTPIFSSAGCIQTNDDDLLHATALDPVLVHGQLEDLNGNVDSARVDAEGMSELVHPVLGYEESQRFAQQIRY